MCDYFRNADKTDLKFLTPHCGKVLAWISDGTRIHLAQHYDDYSSFYRCGHLTIGPNSVTFKYDDE